MKHVQRTVTSAAIVALSAGALFSPLSAQAGSYATATIGDLQFRLIDLDASDAYLSSYVLNPSSGNRSSVSTSTSDASLGWSDSASKTRDQVFYDLSLDSSTGQAQAHAEVNAQGVAAEGSAAGWGTTFNASAATGSNNSYYSSIFAIDLSPRTVLIVTADASVTVWAGNAGCNVDTLYGGYACGYESASGNVNMALSYSYYGSGVSASYSFNDGLSASVNASGYYSNQYDHTTGIWRSAYSGSPDQRNQSSRQLTAVFTNSSDSVQRASLNLSASVQGYASTPIPEASTTAMFALGLLGLAGVARRRRG